MFGEVLLAYQSIRITVATSFYRPTRKVDATRSVNAPRIMVRLWPILIITRPVGFTSEYDQRIWLSSNYSSFCFRSAGLASPKMVSILGTDKVSIPTVSMYLMCSLLYTSLDALIGTQVGMGDFGTHTITDFNC